MDYVSLGRRARERRREMKLTQEEVARQAGISASFLGHVERGTRVLSVETLVNLCEALQLTPNELLSMEHLACEVPQEMKAFAQESVQAMMEIAKRHFGNQ